MSDTRRIPNGHEGMEGYPVSQDNYLTTVVSSLNALEFIPERHMPLPVEDLAAGPLKQRQIGLSRDVVFHALSFPTLDAYLDHSVQLAEALREPYANPLSVLYWGCSPLELQRRAFGRHVGFAFSHEHERLDELLEGLRQAYLRGDEVMQGINAGEAFGTAYWQIRYARSSEDCPVSLVSPSGRARSLGLFSMLLGDKLQRLLLDAFQKDLTPVIQAVVLGQNEDAVFAEHLSNNPPVLAANLYMESLGLAEVRAYRRATGFSPFPERQEIHKRFESLLKSERPFEQGQALAFYEYAHGNSEAWQVAVEECFLQSAELVTKVAQPSDVMNNPAIQSALRALGAITNPVFKNALAATAKPTRAPGPELADVTRNIMAVFAELKDTACPVQQMATACLWAPSTETYAAIMATPNDGLLERIAALYTAEKCSTSPNLLAVLRCQPIKAIRDWAAQHDPEDDVVYVLYKMTNDTKYLEMVKSLVRRGELFGQDLGL